MMITIIIIIVMKMICWMTRTGANPRRSSPLPMIIAIIIVTFYYFSAVVFEL